MKKILIGAVLVFLAGGPLPIAYAADQYEWQGQFTVSSSQPGSPPANVILKGGPFTTQQQCYSDAGSTPQAKYPNQTVTLSQPPGFTCVCDKPLSQQSSCSDYVAPAPPAAATPAAATPTPSSGGNTFVSISQIPVFNTFTSPTNLPAFLNQLYLICIGAAVVLAVLQLIRAGIMYTMGDSGFAKIEEAKHLITTSLLGLLLVLSPYIVFTVINPAILNLNININGIKPSSEAAPSGIDTSHGAPDGDTISCTAYTQGASVNKPATCSVRGAGFVAAPNNCCSAVNAASQTCCALPKTTPPASSGW